MHESFVVRFLQKQSNVKKFTLQEEILRRRRHLGGGGHRAQSPVLNYNEKHPFLFFSIFLIKAFLSSNMQRMLQKLNAAKSQF